MKNRKLIGILIIGIMYILTIPTFAESTTRPTLSIHNETIDLDSPLLSAEADSYYYNFTWDRDDGNFIKLNDFTHEELKYLRNAYFAKYGYVFNNSKYNDYFSHYDWYQPNESIVDINSHLNETDWNNIKFVTKLERFYKDERNSNFKYLGVYQSDKWEDPLIRIWIKDYHNGLFDYSVNLWEYYGELDYLVSGQIGFSSENVLEDTDNGFRLDLINNTATITHKGIEYSIVIEHFWEVANIDYSLNGGQIAAGMSFEELQRNFNLEHDLVIPQNGVYDNEQYYPNNQTIDIGELELTFYEHSNGENEIGMYRYRLVSDEYTLYRGIKVGDNFYELLQLYGEPGFVHDLDMNDPTGKYRFTYSNGFSDITFYVEDNTIYSIVYESFRIM